MNSLSGIKLRWNSDNIDYSKIDGDKIKKDVFLCYSLILASFAESRDYAWQLPESMPESTEKYLDTVWEPEEVQHGVALKKCVMEIFPMIDWDHYHRLYMDHFMKTEFTQFELVQPYIEYAMEKAIEETGTSTTYTTLYNAAKYLGDPTLEKVLLEIKYDECGHYVQFAKMIKEAQSKNPIPNWKKLKFLLKRVVDIKKLDLATPFPIVMKIFNDYSLFSKEDSHGMDFKTITFEQFHSKFLKIWWKKYFPHKMAVTLFIKLIFPNSKKLQKLFTPVGMALTKSYIAFLG
jgi:hypothetical protein